MADRASSQPLCCESPHIATHEPSVEVRPEPKPQQGATYPHYRANAKSLRRGVKEGDQEPRNRDSVPPTTYRSASYGRVGVMVVSERNVVVDRQLVLDVHAIHSVQPPNGSRLSCGRTAQGRKEVERQRTRLAGEATQFFPI